MRKVIAAFLIAAGLFLPVLAYSEAGNRDNTIRHVLIHEGGARYTNHPNDPGGPTKYGITIHDVRRYLKPGATAQDVKNLTERQAIEIYRAHYWNEVRADELPRGLDYTVVDYSVNAGVGRGGKALRRAVGAPQDTHRVTDAIIAAVNKMDPRLLIIRVNEYRMAFQMGLGPKFNVFKRGWRNRILSVKSGSLDMAGSLDKGILGSDFSTIPRIGGGKAYDDEEDVDVR